MLIWLSFCNLLYDLSQRIVLLVHASCCPMPSPPLFGTPNCSALRHAFSGFNTRICASRRDENAFETEKDTIGQNAKGCHLYDV